MNLVGVVAEYNPFHLGHLRHLAETRSLVGSDAAIVCVMSGDFVQRGEPAAFDKFTRAEAACRSGADLVIELPLPWCLSSAEGFARGAVSLLSHLGCTHLSFGSEAGSIERLETLADAMMNESFLPDVRARMRNDPAMSYAAACQLAVSEVSGSDAGLLEKPNNLLAIEYLKAIRSLDSDMKPLTVTRIGSEHDGEGGTLPSASELRVRMRAGEDISAQIPASAFAVYFRENQAGRGMPDRDRLDTAILSRLRTLPQEVFEQLPDAGDGLGRRLWRAASEEPDLNSLCDAVKTKRYAHSRIRRMVCCAALGIRSGMTKTMPPYARVLAANACGCGILRKAALHSELPVLTKPAAVHGMSEQALACFTLGAAAHDLYVLGYDDLSSRRGGEDWRTGPVIV